jgi:hypothetical protein
MSKSLLQVRAVAGGASAKGSGLADAIWPGDRLTFQQRVTQQEASSPSALRRAVQNLLIAVLVAVVTLVVAAMWVVAAVVLDLGY